MDVSLASSFGSDFNHDFNVSITEEQQHAGGIEYNYRRDEKDDTERALEGQRTAEWSSVYGDEGPVARFAAMCGTDARTYLRDRPGMSAFVLEDGVVYHTFPPMRADWMVSGACISGSIVRRAGATRRVSGGVATTSTAIRVPAAVTIREHVQRDPVSV